ncbi:BLUF domain-containing protein [Rhodoferax sp.]|uniref:BLUF domain-containing protein n=1 Tax=Rhodoferax sp. TaxID=50421 RepID=UPI0026277596|nr:BLUF domain-containing protein [Rhodoferax sp.]MDD2924245.1 BLUF domain-containing protein [Rhodoferax sp.]
MLVRLLYASRAVDTSSGAIESILHQSREHNPASGVTGVLCYGSGIFLQVLEGGRMTVSELFGHIQRDPRHKDVVLLSYEEIAERRFAGWTMGEVNMTRINTSILLKYAEKAELDPYSVSGKVSLALIEELMITACVVGRA